ncbi:MAG: deoxyguanosinetriphosphate triphosphohydrolase [Candidatus Gracilibacteria bacterium]|nr:deoxyguanosinetriphosphate triphosphohydrolase [Candidatus Gracilibacteria bacterium]
MIFTRKELEKIEKSILAPYAVKSIGSKGRKFPEREESSRMCFQKDKERIIHSKAFRRLDKKTQVFMAGSGDHFRTRLTHTLEVAQISRDLARRLGLNEDLCETIALAHDLGHPPFGHGGEEALNEIMEKHGMHFEHNEQSQRIVEILEKSYPNFDGLNLTREVLDGMIKHQTAFDQAGKRFEVFPHLESQVVNIADEIAYTNHDIDDGLRSGMIKISQLSKFELWKKASKLATKKHGSKLSKEVIVPRTVSSMMSLMIADMSEYSEKNLKKGKMILEFSPRMKKMIKEVRKFLFKNFYMNPLIIKIVIKGKKMIKELFDFYLKNPDFLPKTYKTKNDFVVAVKDYIAGMTDSFLIQEYEKFIIKKK